MASSSSTRSIQKHLADITFLEKLGLFPKRAFVVANVFVALFTGVFRGARKPSAYYRYVILTAFRTLLRITSLKQQHYMQPTTDESYLIACKKLNLKPESEILPDGTTAHWLGPKTASKIIVNFHGGGYVLTAAPEMFEVSWLNQQFVSKQGIDVALIFLSYDLAPAAQYPRQLTQATALMDHLVNNLSKKPSDIILMGDSAGANLITQLISHISHPHPSVPKFSISEKFRGICLIAPWVNFDTSAASFKKNTYTDFILPVTGKKWSSAFMGTPWPHSNSDAYNEASKAPKGWWDDMMVDKVLIVGGEREVLIDSIKSFADTFREVIGDRLTTVYAPGEMHDEPNMEPLFGYKEPGIQTQAVRTWLRDMF